MICLQNVAFLGKPGQGTVFKKMTGELLIRDHSIKRGSVTVLRDVKASSRLGTEGLMVTDSHADVHKTHLYPVCPGSEKPNSQGVPVSISHFSWTPVCK